MTDQSPTKRVRFRFLRRLFKTIVLLTIGIILLSVGSVAAVWGHFWEFRIGDPTSSSCGTCHSIDQYITSETDSSLLISNHVREGLTCTDCHQFSIEQQIYETVRYLQNDYAQPLTQRDYKMDFCFRCHEHSSYDQLAWRTTDLGITDPRAAGAIANPHQPPHFEDLECNNCHRMHQPSVLLCTECHSYAFRFPVIAPGN